MGHLIPAGTGFSTHRDIESVKKVLELSSLDAPAAEPEAPVTAGDGQPPEASP